MRPFCRSHENDLVDHSLYQHGHQDIHKVDHLEQQDIDQVDHCAPLPDEHC